MTLPDSVRQAAINTAVGQMADGVTPCDTAKDQGVVACLEKPAVRREMRRYAASVAVAVIEQWLAGQEDDASE